MQSCTFLRAVVAYLQLAPSVPSLDNENQNLAIRQAQPQPSCPDFQFPSSNGNRKIAFLMDGSFEIDSLDPYGYRIPAAESISNSLISQAHVTNGSQADLVTVIEGHGFYSRIFSPLGDPSSVNFRGIDVGGHDMGGLNITIDELTKDGRDDGHMGVVIFTSHPGFGTDDISVQLNRTANYGIRVSYGLLVEGYSAVPSATSQNLSSLLRGGGTYCLIHDAPALWSYASLVIARGLTESDSAANNAAISTLVPGLSFVAILLPSTSSNFTYQSRVGETVEISAACVDECKITSIVRNLSNGTTLYTDKTGPYDAGAGPGSGWSLGFAVSYKSIGGEAFGLQITSDNSTSEQMVVVGIKSSFGAANCSVNATTPTTMPSPSTSVPGSSSSPSATSSIGLSVGAKAGIGIGAAALGFAILLTTALCVRRRWYMRATESPGSGVVETYLKPELPSDTVGPRAELPDFKDTPPPIEMLVTEAAVELETRPHDTISRPPSGQLADTERND